MTLTQLQTKIRLDGDIHSTNVSDTELTGVINDAIKIAEAEIHTLYEDYFLTSANITTVVGTSEYAFPSDIYANKIRKILFDDDSSKYNINRIKNLQDLLDIEDNDDYRYIIKNSSTSNIIKLYPTAREASATNITVWYIRNAKQLSGASDVCDIPEFESFIMWYARYLCMINKDIGNPMLPVIKNEVDNQRQLMITTLEEMVPDEDNFIQGDMSFYEDFNNDEGLFY